jgi:hypothetical protein
MWETGEADCQELVQAERKFRQAWHVCERNDSKLQADWEEKE